MTMARADQRSKEAYYLAEAGIEDGRASLHAANGNGGRHGGVILRHPVVAGDAVASKP